MAVVWLILAAFCLLAGGVLLVLDRRRARPAPDPEPAAESLPSESRPSESPPLESPTSEVEDLFTPDALPRDPDS